MPFSHFAPADPAGPAFRAAVGERIARFCDLIDTRLAAVSPLLRPLGALAREFTEGGKRIRPAFGYWGHAAVAGEPTDPQPLLGALAGFELLHVSALVHDDVIDASDTRRGHRAVHRQLEDLHRASHGLGDPEAFGRAGAILLGDLLSMWSVELVETSGLDEQALARGRAVLDLVRTEVNAGQFLDLSAEAGLTSGADPIDVAERVVEYKTARYTVVRPLQFGAALAGADQALLDRLARLGSPLGRAFQLRDDLLGVFGDERRTGKPAGDDLREGKRTVLLVEGLVRAPRLGELLGRPLGAGELDRARRLLVDCGAVADVEARIDRDAERARAELATLDITDAGRTALEALVEACVRRDS